ncbi:MAG: hypothetical protein R3C40_07260 [Parvularculaceae bacterium]
MARRLAAALCHGRGRRFFVIYVDIDGQTVFRSSADARATSSDAAPSAHP